MAGPRARRAPYHAAGVAEIYVTLAWLVAPPTWLVAFIFETVNRLINVVFKFVPMRLGVDEAGSGILASVLGYSTHDWRVAGAGAEGARAVLDGDWCGAAGAARAHGGWRRGR